MTKTDVNIEYVNKSRVFIDQIGYVTLAKKLDITPQAVINWRKRGIPKSYLKYLKIAFKQQFCF